MGLRLILVILALWLVFLIIRHLLRQSEKPQAKLTNKKEVDTVQCIHCGVHLPKDEAIYEEPDFYCSKEHQRLG